MLEQALGLNGIARVRAVSYEGEAPFQAFDRHLPVSLAQARAKRRDEFLAGRYCAAKALADSGHDGACWLPIGEQRVPLWPNGWVGSISHSGNGAFAAVAPSSRCQGLGVDMERTVTGDHVQEIAAMVALPGELDRLVGLPPERALTLLFSAKEALYKALYPQVRQLYDFSAARLDTWNPDSWSLTLARTWGAGWEQGRRVPVRHVFHGDFVFTAVCLR